MVGIDLGTTNSAIAVRPQNGSLKLASGAACPSSKMLARRHRCCRRMGSQSLCRLPMGRPCRLWLRSRKMAVCWSARPPSGAQPLHLPVAKRTCTAEGWPVATTHSL